MSRPTSRDASRILQACVDQPRCGRPVIGVDDESRENGADLVMAAQFEDVDDVVFCLAQTSGFLYTPVVGQGIDEFEPPRMIRDSTRDRLRHNSSTSTIIVVAS